MKTIHLICAARPNFMKIAPLWHALQKEDWCKAVIVHTGQHYDPNMSDNFFRDLRLPDPDVSLGVGSGTHAEQTGRTMIEYEKLCSQSRPDIIVVVGDVNATVACALVGAKMLISVVHLEAGLRSRDRTMPEEINRIVTDSISTLLLTPSVDADDNLRREGISDEKIKMVGNIMIDSLEMLREVFEMQALPESLTPLPDRYIVLTLHRPSNVDNRSKLTEIIHELTKLAGKFKIIFPVHPRTEKQLEHFNLWSALNADSNFYLSKPLGYNEFIHLVLNASAVVTDSGGIQEETTYLGIPCFTIRENTERPITISHGTNRLIGPKDLCHSLDSCATPVRTDGCKIPFWDGLSAARIVEQLRWL